MEHIHTFVGQGVYQVNTASEQGRDADQQEKAAPLGAVDPRVPGNGKDAPCHGDAGHLRKAMKQQIAIHHRISLSNFLMLHALFIIVRHFTNYEFSFQPCQSEP
jgi:hypothetical protein